MTWWSRRATGLDVLSGEGLAGALAGADALIPPIPADEAAAAVARAATGKPINGIVNIGGPAKITFEQMARDVLARSRDTTKTVVVDREARYYGARLSGASLTTPE